VNEQEFKALKATMPWTERVFNTNKGGLVQIIDNAGNEVPIFTMTRFLVMITDKLARGAATEKEPENEKASAAN